jgi:tRNA pseudouridine55 synthase
VQRYLMPLPKSYLATARLGWRSDTGDRDGELTPTGRVPADPRIPEGPQLQRPPAYSAVKLGGERLYERARRGDAIEGAPREVVVHHARTLAVGGERARFEIVCSSGTYVRQLIADLGDAYCEQLERVAIGPFRLEDADPERIVALEQALAFLPERPLSADELLLVGDGRSLEGGAAGEEVGPQRLTGDGRLLAIGEASAGRIKPVVVFPR